MRPLRTIQSAAFGIVLLGSALLPVPGRASVAWKDGKAYTAMLAGAAEDAANKVKTAIDNLNTAKNTLAQAQNALTMAATAVSSAAATSAVANAQAAVATAEAAVAEASAGAPYVAAAFVGAVGGTLIGQGLRGLWSACLDPVCSLHATFGFSSYVPITPAQTFALFPTLSSLATSGSFSLSESDFAALGPAGQPASDILADGAALLVDTARGASAVAAGDFAQAAIAAADLNTKLIGYRTAIATFAATLPGVGLTSPTSTVDDALTSFNNAVATAIAVCDPGAGDNCAALDAALATATTQFDSAATTLTATQFSDLVGGTDPYIPTLTLSAFDAFLASCASLGAACLPSAETDLANELINVSGTTFDLPSAIAAYDATGDVGGEEAALFTDGLLELPDLLLGSATTLSDCGHPDCTWLLINPFDSALIPEPPISMILLGSSCLLLFFRNPWYRGNQRSAAEQPHEQAENQREED